MRRGGFTFTWCLEIVKNGGNANERVETKEWKSQDIFPCFGNRKEKVEQRSPHRPPKPFSPTWRESGRKIKTQQQFYPWQLSYYL